MRVDQVVETLEYGDAISSEAGLIRDRLRERGFDSTLFAERAGERVAGQVKPFSPHALAGADALIYHHGIGGDLARRVIALPVRKALLYHNITPPQYFAPYGPAYAGLLASGRDELRTTARAFDIVGADSDYNAQEIRRSAGCDVTVVPFPVDPRRFACEGPAAQVPAATGTRWLSVGRVVPNKGLFRLVASFRAYLAWEPAAELVIVGRFTPTDGYHLALRAEIARLGLEARVRLTGGVDDDQLAAWYRSSDVYLALSEHEGFCVPLVEAMLFDLPIVAAANAAVPETLGAAGLQVDDDASPVDVAALVAELRRDENLRRMVVAAQRLRRAAFAPDAVVPVIDRFVDALVRSTEAHRSGANTGAWSLRRKPDRL